MKQGIRSGLGFVSFLCTLAVVGSARAVSYHLTDLGSLPGGTTSAAYGINNMGQIVGQSAGHAFVYSNGVMQDLGTLSGGSSSQAYDISDTGQVVGSSRYHVSGTATSGSYDTTSAFRESGGSMASLGALPHESINSTAFAMNSAGQVVGQTLAFDVGQPYHAFLYNDGQMVNLGTLDGPSVDFPVEYSYAYGINSSGVVVGTSDYVNGHAGGTPLLNHKAFIYNGSAMQPLSGVTDFESSTAYGINDRGDVVGYTFGASLQRAFLNVDGVMTDLGAGIAYGVNNSSQVVVASEPNGYPSLYTGGAMHDLTTMVDASAAGWDFYNHNASAGVAGSYALNDSAWIVGTGTTPSGAMHGYLLRPNAPGDYDGNGTVGPEDYKLWLTNFGSTTFLVADGNGNGVVDAADFTIWRDHLGTSLGTGTSSALPLPPSAVIPAVPEPATISLAVIASILIATFVSRGRES